MSLKKIIPFKTLKSIAYFALFIILIVSIALPLHTFLNLRVQDNSKLSTDSSLEVLRQIEEINKLNQSRQNSGNGLNPSAQTKAEILSQPKKIVPVSEFDAIGIAPEKPSITEDQNSANPKDLPDQTKQNTSAPNPDEILNETKPKPDNFQNVLPLKSSLKDGSNSVASVFNSVFGSVSASAQSASSPFLGGFPSGDVELPWTSGEDWVLTCGYQCQYHTGKTKYLLNFARNGGDTTTFNKPVLAMTSGIVTDFKLGCARKSDGCNGGWGNYIIMQVADGKYIEYHHLSLISVTAVGQEILRGQEIGRSGDSGFSTASHIQVALTSAPHTTISQFQTEQFPVTKGVWVKTGESPITTFSARESTKFISTNVIGNLGGDSGGGSGGGDVDPDKDNISDAIDNCPDVYNPDQADTNQNGLGDACEANFTQDKDNDGIVDNLDNCPNVPNPDQSDKNSDGKGDVCDATFNHIICPNGQPGDDPGTVFDTCSEDYDGDGIPNKIDNCKSTPNPNQMDTNQNGLGDACDKEVFKTRKGYNPKFGYYRNLGYNIPIGTVGDPVNSSNGNFFYSQNDVTLPGPGKSIQEDIAPELNIETTGLNIERTYNSVDQRQSVFGKGWNTDLLTYTDFLGSESNPEMGVNLPGGSLDVFDRKAQGNCKDNGNSDPNCYSFQKAVDSTGTTANLKYVPAAKYSNQAWTETCPLPPKPSAKETAFLESYKQTQKLINGGGLTADNSVNTDSQNHLPDLPGQDQKTIYPECYNLLYSDKFGNQTLYHWDTSTDVNEDNNWKAGLPILTKTVQGQIITYNFDDAAKSDSQNPELNFRYLKSISNNFGQTLNFSFNQNGKIESITDNLNRTIKYTYDFEGNLIQVQAPGSDSSTTYAYTPSGFLNLVIDPTGRKIIQNTYDSQGKVVLQKDAKDQETTLSYNFGSGSFSNKTVSKHRDGTTTEHYYDALGRLTKEVDPNGNTKEYKYKDNSFAKTEVKDELGRITTTEYDSSDNPIKITLPDGSVTNNQFNQYSELTQKNQDGQFTNLTYDETRLTSKSFGGSGMVNQTPEGKSSLTPATTKFNWNSSNYTSIIPSLEGDKTELPESLKPGNNQDLQNLSKVYSLNSLTDPNGNTTTYNLDQGKSNELNTSGTGNSSFRPNSITNPDGGQAKLEYDAVGRITKRISPAGGTTTITYDDRDNIVKTSNTLGGVTEYIYLPNNLLLAKKDSTGLLQVLSYDLNKKLTLSRQCLNTDATATTDGRINPAPTDGMVNQTPGMVNQTPGMVNQTPTTTDLQTLASNCLSKPSNEAIYTPTSPYGVNYDQLSSGLQDKYAAYSVYDISFKYDSMDRLIETTDAVGRITSYTLDKLGNRTEIIQPDLSKQKMEYDEASNLIRQEDELGRATVYSFDELNRVKTITRPDIRQKTIVYDKFGNITSIKDFDNNTQKFEYDAQNNLTRQTDKNGNSNTYSYDLNNNLIQKTDTLGYVTKIEYNNINKPKLTILPNKLKIENTYNLTGQLVKQIYADGLANQTSTGTVNQTPEGMASLTPTVYTYTYDPSGNLVSVVNPLGGTTAYTFDNSNRKISETTYLGEVNDSNKVGTTSFTYDTLSRLSTITDPQGNISQTFYSPSNEIVKQVDRNKNATAYHFDIRGNLIKQTDALNNSRHFSYYLDNSLKCQTTFKPVETVFLPKTNQFTNLSSADFNNPNGQGKEDQSSEGQASQYLQSSNHLSNPSYAFDYTRLPENYNLLNNKETSCLEYNTLNQVVKQTDNLGQSTLFEYDRAGNIIRIVNPKAQETKLSYDKNSNLTSVTDTGGFTTSFVYDKANRKISQTNSKNQTTTFIYDAVGNTIATIYPNPNDGKNIDLSLITGLYPNEGNKQASNAQTEGMASPIPNNGMVNQTSTLDLAALQAQGFSISAAKYNTLSSLTASIDPNGNQITYSYNPNQQLDTLTDASGNKTTKVYDKLGRLTTVIYPDEARESFKYDNRNNLISYTNRFNGIEEYAFDANQNQTLTKTALDNRIYVSFDALNRPVKSFDDITVNRQANSYLSSTGSSEADLLLDGDKGLIQAISYDPNGLVVSITDAFKNQTNYQYDPNGRLIQTFRDGLDQTGNSAPNQQNNQVSQVFGSNGTVSANLKYGQNPTVTPNTRFSQSYTFDAIGKLLKSSDELGNQTEYAYNSQNNLNQIKLPNQSTTKLELDSLGNQTAVTDALNRTTKYTLDNLNRTVAVTNPKNQVTSFTFDLASNLIKQTDPKGNSTVTVYQKLQNYLPKTKSDELGYTTNYKFDGLERLIEFTDKNKNTSKYSYNTPSRIQTETLPQNQVTTTKLNETGQTVSTTLPNNAKYQYTYDIRGRLVATVNPDSGVETQSFDPLNRLTRTVSPNLGVTSFAYGPNSELLATKLPDNELFYNQYDAKNQLIAKILPTTKSGESIGQNQTPTVAKYGYLYDSVGNLIETLDPTGAKTSNKYDAVSHLIQTTNPNNESTLYAFDEVDNLVKTTDPNNQSSTYTFDANQNLIAVVDPNGNTTKFDYTKRNELSLKTDPLSRTNQYFYDPNGNEINWIKADGSARVQAFDKLNRVATRQYQTKAAAIASPGTFNFSYNQINNLTKATQVNTDGSVNQNLYDYDLIGRAIGQYQGSDSIFGQAQIGNTATNSVSTFAYDSNGNLATETIGVAGIENGGNVNLKDLRFDLVAQNFNPSQRHTFEYTKGDKLSKLEERLFPATNTTAGTKTNQNNPGEIVNRINFEYDQAGQLTKKQFLNNQAETYSYDIKGRILSSVLPGGKIEDTTPASAKLPLDRGTGESSIGANTGFKDRTYDSNDRITSEYNLSLGKLTFEYDKLSRLTKYTSEGQGNTPNIKDVDPLKGVKETQTFEYDPNGNRIKATLSQIPGNSTNGGNANSALTQVTANQYDVANQLVKSVVTGQSSLTPTTQTFTYDLNGNRTTNQTNGLITSQTIYDGENKPELNIDYITNDITSGETPSGQANTNGDHVIASTETTTNFTYYNQDFLHRETGNLSSSVNQSLTPNQVQDLVSKYKSIAKTKQLSPEQMETAKANLIAKLNVALTEDQANQNTLSESKENDKPDSFTQNKTDDNSAKKDEVKASDKPEDKNKSEAKDDNKPKENDSKPSNEPQNKDQNTETKDKDKVEDGANKVDTKTEDKFKVKDSTKTDTKTKTVTTVKTITKTVTKDSNQAEDNTTKNDKVEDKAKTETKKTQDPSQTTQTIKKTSSPSSTLSSNLNPNNPESKISSALSVFPTVSNQISSVASSTEDLKTVKENTGTTNQTDNSNKTDSTKVKDGNPDDNNNGKGNEGQASHAPTAASTTSASTSTNNTATPAPTNPTTSTTTAIKVSPVLECVWQNEGKDSEYVAVFGYNNQSKTDTVVIPVGTGSNNTSANYFNPSPVNRNQPTEFKPGRQVANFAVLFDGKALVWTLKSPDGTTSTSTASSSSTKCKQNPIEVETKPTPVSPTDPKPDSGNNGSKDDGDKPKGDQNTATVTILIPKSTKEYNLTGDKTQLNQTPEGMVNLTPTQTPNSLNSSILNTQILDVLNLNQANINTQSYRQFSFDATTQTFGKYYGTEVLPTQYSVKMKGNPAPTKEQTSPIATSKKEDTTPIATQSPLERSTGEGLTSNNGQAQVNQTPTTNPYLEYLSKDQILFPTTSTSNNLNTQTNIFSPYQNPNVSSLSTDPMGNNFGSPTRKLLGSTHVTTQFDYTLNPSISIPNLSKSVVVLDSKENPSSYKMQFGLSEGVQLEGVTPKTTQNTTSPIASQSPLQKGTGEGLNSTPDTFKPIALGLLASGTLNYNYTPGSLTQGDKGNNENGVGSGNTISTTTQPKYITQSIFTNNFSYHSDYQNTLNSITNSKDGKLALTQAFDPFGVQKSFGVSSVKETSPIATPKKENTTPTTALSPQGKSTGETQNPNLSSPFNTQIPLYSYSGSLDEGRAKVREMETPNTKGVDPLEGVKQESSTQTLNFGRRSYNPNQGIFTTEDPVTQGVSYNISGIDSLVGSNHQSLNNSTNNQYNLINQNPRGGKDVDGYVTDQQYEDSRKQALGIFAESVINSFNNTTKPTTEIYSEYSMEKVPHRFVPSSQDYASSPEKLANDNLATQVAFASICKSADSTPPYNCNSYHSQIAKNYDLSVSPNINGFSSYKQNNSYTYFTDEIKATTKTRQTPYSFKSTDILSFANSFISELGTNETKLKSISNIQQKYQNEKYQDYLKQQIQQQQQASLNSCKQNWQCSLSLNTINFATEDHYILGKKYNIIDNVESEYLKPGIDCINQSGTIFDTAIACGSYSSIGPSGMTPANKQMLGNAMYGEDLNKCSGMIKVEWYWQTGHCTLLALDAIEVGEAFNAFKGVKTIARTSKAGTATLGLKDALNTSLTNTLKRLGAVDELSEAAKDIAKTCRRVAREGEDGEGVEIGERDGETKDKNQDEASLDVLASVFGGVEVQASYCPTLSPRPTFMKKTSELVRNERPRMSDIHKLAKSFADEGYDIDSALHVYKDNDVDIVINGNTRLIAARKAGINELPIKYITKEELKELYDLTPELLTPNPY